MTTPIMNSPLPFFPSTTQSDHVGFAADSATMFLNQASVNSSATTPNPINGSFVFQTAFDVLPSATAAATTTSIDMSATMMMTAEEPIPRVLSPSSHQSYDGGNMGSNCHSSNNSSTSSCFDYAGATCTSSSGNANDNGEIAFPMGYGFDSSNYSSSTTSNDSSKNDDMVLMIDKLASSIMRGNKKKIISPTSPPTYQQMSSSDTFQLPSSSTITAKDGADDHQLQKDDYALFAKELAELSESEREMVYDEVHGVAKNKEDHPEFCKKKALAQLNERLRKVPQAKRKALDRAFFLKPSLESDEEFKLMFLRADRYDATKAATRMASYFHNKAELWGEDKMVKPITVEDFEEDPNDMAALRSGIFQCLQKKDQSGRLVFFTRPYCDKFKDWKNYARYVWYEVMAGLEDKEAQINGVVSIVCCHNLDRANQRKFLEVATQAAPVLNILPCRMLGFHFCYGDPDVHSALSYLQLSLGKQTRLRFRAHYGTRLENKDMIQSFGIPVEAVPLMSDGNILNTQVHDKYLQERQELEGERKRLQASKQKTSGDIIYPTSRDVLVGRGRPYQEFQGNLRYSRIIDLNLGKYLSATNRFEKTCIFMDVVKLIQDTGGRFLQRTGTGWVTVNDSVAREKVSHIFRTKTSRLSSAVASSSTTLSSFQGRVPSYSITSSTVSPPNKRKKRANKPDKGGSNDGTAGTSHKRSRSSRPVSPPASIPFQSRGVGDVVPNAMFLNGGLIMPPSYHDTRLSPSSASASSANTATSQHYFGSVMNH